MATEREGTAVIVAADLLTRSRLEAAARAAGFEPAAHAASREPARAEPAVLAVDLDAPDGIDAVRAWRARWPELRIVGFVSHVDRTRWSEAVALGCEVYPRGATTGAAGILRGE